MKISLLRNAAFIILISFISLSFITNNNNNISIEDRIIAFFYNQSLIPQEKLYLHLDKPYYAAGDKIWFKGYLLNGMTHEDNALSNFFYIELINEKDSVLIRRKIKRDSTGFNNMIPIPAAIEPGNYYLRAYTNWMCNMDSNFFFYKNLYIDNSIATAIQSNITYETGEEGEEAVIRFTNEQAEPFIETKIRYSIGNKNDHKTKNGRTRTDDKGEIRIPIPNDRWGEKGSFISVMFNDETYEYGRTFYLPPKNKDFAVSFFPEGGNLITGALQQVAFKAQQEDGFSCEISGAVLDSKGDTVTLLRSEHDGMGVFSFTPTAEPYKAIITAENGETRSFDIPQASHSGFNLRINHRQNSVIYQITAANDSLWNDSIYIAAHVRGQLILLNPVTAEQPAGMLSTDSLPEGIAHFLLVNKESKPLNERLIFINHPLESTWKVQSDKPQYGTREKIKIDISAQKKDGTPIEGDFSVSVTNNSHILVDSLSDNICSYLLLTSDLKGYIENPAYYFIDNSVVRQKHLDYVMLTHGWRRFSTNNIDMPEIPEIKRFIEKGQYISGHIKNFFGKNAKNPFVKLMCIDIGILKEIQADEQGNFIFDSLNYTDTMTFKIQAKTKSGFSTVDVVVDKDSFPVAYNKYPYAIKQEVAKKEYLDDLGDTYIYEGGMEITNLKEVTVTAKKKEVIRNRYGGINDTAMGIEEIEKKMPGAHNAFDIIMRMPGIMISGESVRIRNNQGAPMLMIQGSPFVCNAETLRMILTDDIESIEILSETSSSFMGSNGRYGAIIINLKQGEIQKRRPNPTLQVFTSLGYSQKAEFYSPVYDTPQQPDNGKKDLRSTLYWNPAVKTDSTGCAQIEFYTSDQPADYHIIIEGTDQKGHIYRYSNDIVKP